jgi:hypothetical protein
MADNSFYTALIHQLFEILGFLYLLLLGCESLLKHSRPVLEAARLLYLDVKSWKADPQDRPVHESSVTTRILPPKT